MSGAGSPTLLGSYGPWIGSRMSGLRRDLSFLDPRWSDCALWREEARGLFDSLVLRPRIPEASRWPLASVLTRRTRDGLEEERLSWRLPWGPESEALFIKPAGAKGRLPGLLAFHDHGGNKYHGKEKIAGPEGGPFLREYRERYYGGRAWADECARRGFGVLVTDAFLFGSRRILPSELSGDVVRRLMRNPEELRELEGAVRGEPCFDYDPPEGEDPAAIGRYNAFGSQYESVVAKSLFSAGLSWPGVFLAEDGLALDYLCSRADVDPERVGCCGLSGGGLRTDYLAGADSRVACSVTVGFMTTWRDLALASSFTHTWMVYVPGLPDRMDFPEILGMRVPSPALVIASRGDPLFDPEEVGAAEGILRGIYAKAGAPERFRMSWYEGGHRFDLPMQEEAFAWLERWLRPGSAR